MLAPWFRLPQEFPGPEEDTCRPNLLRPNLRHHLLWSSYSPPGEATKEPGGPHFRSENPVELNKQGANSSTQVKSRHTGARMGSLTAPQCCSHSLVYILCNVFLLWGKATVPEQTHTRHCPLAATHIREARNCKGTPLEPQGRSVTTRHTPHRGPIPAPRAQQRPLSRDVRAACTLQREAGSAWSIQTLRFATSTPLILRLCAQARDGCLGRQPTSWPRISASAVQPGAQPPFQKQLGTNRLLRSWPRPASPCAPRAGAAT